MDSIKTIVPIFIGKTRSFWLGIVPTALTTADLVFAHLTGEGSEPVANAIAAAVQQLGLDWTGEQIAAFMRTLYPVYLLIFAQQRGTFSGAVPRPYTIDPAREKQIARVVEDGKSAFDAGRKIGEALRKAGAR